MRRFALQGMKLLLWLVLLSAVSGVFAAPQAEAAGFSTTGSLATARYFHSATLLPDGKILIAGGTDRSNVVMNSAELYDPATGVFAAAGGMTAPRREHTATVLPSGKVLIAGGGSNTAELYDPATGVFAATGSMMTAHRNHTATLLPDGRVLIAGGGSNSAELYDPVTETFTFTGDLTDARTDHSATLLPNGKVLIAGGTGTDSELNTAELYDPATGAFTATGSMLNTHTEHIATLLPNGKVLIAGGNISPQAELYDPATGTFSATGSMTMNRGHLTATLLPSGKVLITGGYGGGGIMRYTELYDPATGVFTAGADMATGRIWHTATLLPSGKVLIAGGTYNIVWEALNSAEVYDYAEDGFAATGALTNGRYYHRSTLLSDGKVLTTGGSQGITSEVYDPGSGTFAVVGNMITWRAFHTSTLLPSGKVLIAGGVDNSAVLSSTELYDPMTGTFAASGSMAVSRVNHASIMLPNGKVLIVGGSSSDNIEHNTTELYDPATGTFAATGNLIAGRALPTLTLLPSGKVLVAGGWSSSGNLNSAELYDPATGTFTATGSMIIERNLHTAILLPNGKVLIAGGADRYDVLLNSAELYDPMTGTFSATGSMVAARHWHTATLLSNGKVLVVGGDANGSALDSAELYDPITATFTATASMITARTYHNAVLLLSGKVLLVGGWISTGTVATAELYEPGLGFSNTWRPSVSSITFNPAQPAKLSISGTGFRGISEASGGNYSSSATNYPILQLRRVDNDQTTFILSDPATNWSETSFTSASIDGLLAGTYRATIFVNAIPSVEQLITIAPAAPAISVAPVTHDFGSVMIGSSSAAQDFSITNDGSADLVIGTVTSGTGFNIGAGTCGALPATIAPSGSCTITATFSPIAAGFQNTDLIITSNDPATPIAAISLSGTGIAPSVAVTITTVPGGLGITVDGTSFTAPQTFSWIPGSSHTIATASPQAGTAGTRYVFAAWSDSGALSHAVTAPAAATIYTASFTTEYQLTTAVNPTWGGTVTPASGGWYAANTVVNLSAVPATGYVFVSWTGLVNNDSSTNSTITMFSPLTATANMSLAADYDMFTATGSLGTARYWHTSTLLPDGRVLIAGGTDRSRVLMKSAELYDPATGVFSATTGSMGTARANHTATMLPSGKVLIAGGGSNTAELYDPATGIFTATLNNMIAARSEHTATLLQSGKVLIAGGGSNIAELYDPATGVFTSTGSLVTGHSMHTATLLPDGKVLIAGGGSRSISSAELYDPATGLFSATGDMLAGHSEHTATLLPNGKVLIVGGAFPPYTAELYDPAAGTFSATGGMTMTRAHLSATLLPNGKVLITGGYGGMGIMHGTELYDPATGIFTATGSMATGRIWHTATLLANGRVLVVGGTDNILWEALNSAEVYDYADGAFTATGSMGTVRFGHTSTQLPNGKILITGGFKYNGGSSGSLNSAELYDPATGVFTATGSLATERQLHTATLFPNGKVLIAGGSNSSGDLQSAELYDPATGTFTPTGDMVSWHGIHTATLLPNGKVLIVGDVFNIIELYDPASGTFTTTGSMAIARSYHSATLLPDGKVLIAGGSSHGGVLGSAELYDPATEVFTATGNMATSSYDHTATLLPNGKVLIAGGWNYIIGALSRAELYDPFTGAFSATGNAATARRAHTATLLPNGSKVLIAGGTNNEYLWNGLNSAEMYDYAIGAFTTTGNLTTDRVGHASTLLPSGKIIIMGGYMAGYDVNSFLNSAELYNPGLDFSDAWRPVVSAITFDPAQPTKLSITGSGFRGISEASSGAPSSSATNFPLVQLQRVDNDQTSFIFSDPNANWSDTSFSSVPVYGLPGGTYRATVIANAIPSVERIIVIAPAIGVTPTTLDFGSIAIGASSAPQVFTITNNGAADLAINSVTTGAGFTVGAGTCGALPATIAPSGSCTVTATFSPASAGTLSANMVIISNDPATPGAVIAVSGIGFVPPVAVTVQTSPAGLGIIVDGTPYSAPQTFSWIPGSSHTIATTSPQAEAAGMRYAFSSWSDGGAIEHIVTVPSAATTYAASFGTEYQLTTVVNPPWGGTISPASGGWYAANTVVSLSAVPADGYVFVSWSGAVSSISGTTATATIYRPLTIAANMSSLSDYTTFAPTGSLATARYYHSATLLPNGKVLIAGGTDRSNVVMNSAELYDPSTGMFTAAGTMTAARREHTATVLPNGMVLIAGGGNNTVELYDPSTGSFAATGSMSAARKNHTATLLRNGTVLIAGGGNNTAEVYDPATGAFSAAGNMLSARVDHTATLLPGALVLIAGGGSNTAELFDPATSAFTNTGSMLTGHSEHTATLLPNGMVLIAGGAGQGASELYDPSTGAFTITGSMTMTRGHLTATLLPNGKVLITGGYGGMGIMRYTELYDPATGVFSATGSMATGRLWHTATLLTDGRVLIAGGTNNILWEALSSAEVYDPAHGAFAATGSMGTSRYNHSSTLLPNGKVLISGGRDISSVLNSTELFDPAAGTFTYSGSMITARFISTATLLSNGKVLIAGGAHDNGILTNSAELYDPATGSFSATGSLAIARYNHTATLLRDGKVLFAGGASLDAGCCLTSNEIYDPSTGVFSSTGSLSTGKYAHTAILLPNGKVLVAGGYNFDLGGWLTSAELYDTATGTFAATGSMTMPRSYGTTATLLPNGKVLIAGGGSDTAELYDPATGAFTATGSMLSVHGGHTAILLPSGKVLIAEGNMTELYDPATGAFTATGSMPMAQSGHTATLLPNGKVLLSGGVGGAYGSTVLDAAQMYDPGLGFTEAWRPVVSAVTFDPAQPTKLSITGSGFRGVSEASGGNYTSSATNYPLLQLQRVDNDQASFILSDPALNWSDTSFGSASVYGLPGGTYRATVFANAIPSMEKIIVIAPALRVNPTAYDFGTVTVGASSAQQEIIITNSGAADLTITAVTAGAGFTVGTGTCGAFPATIAPSGSCTVTAVFTPSAVGLQNTDLVITSNDPATPATTVALSGSGVPPTVAITVQTSPAGLSFTVDGTTYTSAQTFTWTIGSIHTIATASMQSGTAGTRYAFSSWSDGGAIEHVVTAPSTMTVYTATFGTEYQLMTAVAPPSRGTITPPSGGWYAAGTVVNISAAPAAGYVFVSWTGPVADSASASTTVTMSGPRSITANMSRTPSLTARISAKSGPYPARVWTITLQNSGPGQARAAQITGLTLTRTAGPVCTPVITSPAAFPLTVGTITPNGSASGNVTINFTGCSNASRFTVDIPFNSNSGTYSGSTTLTNQTR